MSHELHVIINVTVAIGIALVGGLLAHWLRQPVILGYLVAGIVIGPFTPGFIGDREQISGLAEVGVIFLMFALGIEFSLKELAAVRRVALIGTALQVGLLVAAGMGLGALLGWPFAHGLFLGGIIAISSTMVILKTLLERGEVGSRHGRTLLGMLIVQDLEVILLIVMLPKLTVNEPGLLGDLALTLAKAGGFILVTLVLGDRVVPRVMAAIEQRAPAELFLLTAVTLALGTAATSALLGLSPAFGAFLAGLLLTETEFDHRVIAEVVPMRNVFATLFFVSVGMLIDPAFILANLGAVLGLAAFIIVAKVVATGTAILPFKVGSKTFMFTSLGMIQIGEFSYVLTRAGQDIGVLTVDFSNLVLAASVVTIALTPAAFLVASPLAALVARFPIFGDARLAPQGLAAARVSGHAIVVGYGRVGSQVAAGLRDGGTPVVVVESDVHLVQQMTAAGIPAVYGDGSLEIILAAAGPDCAGLVVIALPDGGSTREVVRSARRMNKIVPVVARASRLEAEAPLYEAGATYVVTPEQAGASLILNASREMLARKPGAPG